MSAKHTPGDWVVKTLETNHHGYDWPTFTIRSKTTNVCLAVVGEVDRYCSEQNEANAILMASAPKLLAALKGLVANQEEGWRALGTTCEEHIQQFPYLRQARAAIIEAEGSK